MAEESFTISEERSDGFCMNNSPIVSMAHRRGRDAARLTPNTAGGFVRDAVDAG